MKKESCFKYQHLHLHEQERKIHDFLLSLNRLFNAWKTLNLLRLKNLEFL